MLSASAYSFRQKSRLAISLSWVAGYTNVITFIVCAVVTSHATGNVTHFGKALADRIDGAGGANATREALYFGGLVVAFFLGAVVRTTHLTGVVTDMGLEGVQFALWAWDKTRASRPGRRGRVMWVSQRHPSVLRLALLASIVGSFLFGVVAGTLAWHYLPQYARIAPVTFLLWILIVDWRKPIADVRELDLLNDPDHRGYGDLRFLLPPEVGVYRLIHHRRDAIHHAPDFQQWVDRLPRQWRVVILAVSPFTHFDKDEALDLAAAVQKLRAEHKDLVVCGVNRLQFKAMRDAGTADGIGMENFCPDLDLAVARALNRVQELVGFGVVRGGVPGANWVDYDSGKPPGGGGVRSLLRTPFTTMPATSPRTENSPASMK